ncbi:hypothetical protein T265_12253 [Opisthorchis viverrini]|uniref:Uncharacterized protein n=1 Tax=Opisthorchis viverrini TaxID=6198 RepID=A0A074YUP0_OPIVI|nr:hypothetical protein T265_12253 [Opisthorchis viverrini]KER18501.1 hypothetical protein T265_12253 [Opisthorchis viverrini]
MSTVEKADWTIDRGSGLLQPDGLSSDDDVSSRPTGRTSNKHSTVITSSWIESQAFFPLQLGGRLICSTIPHPKSISSEV